MLGSLGPGTQRLRKLWEVCAQGVWHGRLRKKGGVGLLVGSLEISLEVPLVGLVTFVAQLASWLRSALRLEVETPHLVSDFETEYEEPRGCDGIRFRVRASGAQSAGF